MGALPLACGWRRHSHRFSLGARTRQSHTGENPYVDMKLEEYVPFSTLTTFKVGGSVRFVLTIEDVSDCANAVACAKEKQLPLIPFGGGSNILGTDDTLKAVMVRVAMQDISVGDDMLVVDAGASWDRVVETAVSEGLWGIENLSGIPGTMGGAVVQNIGAYGAVLSDTLESVTAFDTRTGVSKEFLKAECSFGYRTSIFKTERDRYIILSALLKLSRVQNPTLTYKDLATRFHATAPSLRDIRTAVIEIRRSKFPDLGQFGTAGSFFLNPVVPAQAAERIQERYPEMPVFALPEGGTKVPLGWFFDHVMKLRGHREGNVEAWRAQALVIVAHAGATAKEVSTFAESITTRAKKEIGVEITPEVRVL